MYEIGEKIIYGENGVCTVEKIAPLESGDGKLYYYLRPLIGISESYIRRYPDQYLWFYRRFQNIEPDCPEELKKRYPYYAKVVGPHFYRRTMHDIRAEQQKNAGVRQ